MDRYSNRNKWTDIQTGINRNNIFKKGLNFSKFFSLIIRILLFKMELLIGTSI
jgi:hypothetical protein